MAVDPLKTSDPLDLSACDREPIHIPGSIQPHGILLALDPATLAVRAVSANAAPALSVDAADMLGANLEDITETAGIRIREELGRGSLDCNPRLLGTFSLGEAAGHSVRYDLAAHVFAGQLILELEQSTENLPDVRSQYAAIQDFVTRLQSSARSEELEQAAAREVRRITGFDRVLVYRFDPGWNGNVVAEDRNDGLPSYLNHRFPASDIPKQARDLYKLNRVRLIADAHYVPVPLVAARGANVEPLDLSYSTLRSVSPIHVEYMKNMGTLSSMSVSILREGELWGLISCHHHAPRRVSFAVRSACDFLAQILSIQLAARERHRDYQSVQRLRSIQTDLLAEMAAEQNLVDGLVKRPDRLLELTAAGGAAVVTEGEVRLIGSTPPEHRVNALVQWLSDNVTEETFSTDCLSEQYPDAADMADTASGLISLSISTFHQTYVLWFRPEVVQTVDWGGDPRKPADSPPAEARLHPRKSFETWKEIVRGCSLPWSASEIQAASGFRGAIIAIVLRRAEELASLSEELERSNRELEAFSYSVSHDLRAPFRHIVGYAELLKEHEKDSLDETGQRYLDTIIESAHYAGTLVDNLLSFSQMGRTALHMVEVDLGSLIGEVKRELMAVEGAGRTIHWSIDKMPVVWADPMMLRLAIRNLLENAVKYTRPRDEASITVGCQEAEAEYVLSVRDNGVGFDMQYVDKLFGVFQRLHRMEEFEGTGIGLANVRRIIARHRGRVWADGSPDQGATFHFTLPKPRV